MKPIVQELEDLASVAEGRFTAGIKVSVATGVKCDRLMIGHNLWSYNLKKSQNPML